MTAPLTEVLLDESLDWEIACSLCSSAATMVNVYDHGCPSSSPHKCPIHYNEWRAFNLESMRIFGNLLCKDCSKVFDDERKFSRYAPIS